MMVSTTAYYYNILLPCYHMMCYVTSDAEGDAEDEVVDMDAQYDAVYPTRYVLESMQYYSIHSSLRLYYYVHYSTCY